MSVDSMTVPYSAPQEGVCSLWAVQTETPPPGLMFSLQALLAVKPVSVEEDQEPEVPTHPEDGTLQPGNSKVRRENPSMGCQWRPVRVPRQPPLMETQPGQMLSLSVRREVFVLGQSPTVEPWLVWNSLCRQGWFQT